LAVVFVSIMATRTLESADVRAVGRGVKQGFDRAGVDATILVDVQ